MLFYVWRCFLQRLTLTHRTSQRELGDLKGNQWYGLGSSYRNVTPTLCSWWIVIDPVFTSNRICLRTFIRSLVALYSRALSLVCLRHEILSPHTYHPTLLGHKRQTTRQSCHVPKDCNLDMKVHGTSCYLLEVSTSAALDGCASTWQTDVIQCLFTSGIIAYIYGSDADWVFCVDGWVVTQKLCWMQ